MYISISFSMQREAYVASLIFLSLLYVPTAFISPIVPIEIRSSIPTPLFSNFFAMYTTSLRLCSISVLRAAASGKASIASASSPGSSGGGSDAAPFM